MLVILDVFDRAKLLPYFLKYYSCLGATRFAVGLFNGSQNPLLSEIIQWADQYDLSVRASFHDSENKFHPRKAAHGLNLIRKELVSQGEWYCIADLDEFHFFGGASLQEMATAAEKLGYEAIHGLFCDRVAADGSFPAIEGRLDDRFPLACDLTRCTGANPNKITVAKGHVEFLGGHHLCRSRAVWRNRAEVHHFKWTEGIQRVLEERHVLYVSQGLSYAHEPAKCLNRIRNGIPLTDPELNVRPAAKLGI